MNTSSQTMQSQGSPILLLAYLHTEMGHLPAADFHLSPLVPSELSISLHYSLEAFEAWRVALGLGAAEAQSGASKSWLTSEGTVDDIPVRMLGFAAEADVAAYMAARESVSA